MYTLYELKVLMMVVLVNNLLFLIKLIRIVFGLPVVIPLMKGLRVLIFKTETCHCFP